MSRDMKRLDFLEFPADRTWTSTLVNALDFPATAFANRTIEGEEDGESYHESNIGSQGSGAEYTEMHLEEDKRDGDVGFKKEVFDECFRAFYSVMWPSLEPPFTEQVDRQESTLPKRRKRARRWFMQAAAYDVLMMDRVAAIEKVMQSKGWLEQDEDEEKAKVLSSNMSALQSGTLSAVKKNWGDFTVVDASPTKPTCFAALLVEKPILASRAGSRWPRGVGAPPSSTGKIDEKHAVERIRFLTTGASDVFEQLLGQPVPGRNEAVLRPFKPLFLCYKQMRTRYGEELSITSCGVADIARETRQEQTSDGEAQPTTDPSSNSVPEESVKRDQIRETNKEVTALAMLDLMQNELKAESKTHLACRNRSKQWISFDDLWHLFFTGDLIYDPELDQALQVICVQNGRPILDAYVESTDANALSTPQVAGSKSPFQILAVGIDFNGETFGPVEHEYNIEAWEGDQTITSLFVYPIEYARVTGDESEAEALLFPSAKEAALRSRGKRFCEIVNSSQIAHREYRGFDIGKIREQIDSEVIIDVGYYYELNPTKSPAIGLGRPPPGEKREVIDSIHFVETGKGSNAIFDDRELECERMLAFTRDHTAGLLQKSRVGAELTADRQMLLPSGLWAYVLRTRRWHRLEVNSIRPLDQRQQSFDDLVLQPEYKSLVQGLVRTHSTGVKPTTESVGLGKNDRREDLVRGKGKGVIILLHGVPGVGKSSTAECVAEYTRRPLLSVTCGDIGQTAEQVQWNLEQSLNLAHRWGCVMLLDEADVFLAARDKRDLQRNAIVSVFLRVLEYYSGILFLTTNKVGAFDEAFKSRIHLTLYYDKLDPEQTRKIWEVNVLRQMKLRPLLKIDIDEILRWSERNYQKCRQDGTQIWNGRQIRNACQTAAALAEADAKGILKISHLEAVVKASTEFDRYLKRVHGGDDADRARRAHDREDAYGAASREQYLHLDDESRYADFYRGRNYAYDREYPPRQVPSSRGSRAYPDWDDRAPDPRMEPRDRYEMRPVDRDREEQRYTSERHLSPSRGSAQFPRNPL